MRKIRGLSLIHIVVVGHAHVKGVEPHCLCVVLCALAYGALAYGALACACGYASLGGVYQRRRVKEGSHLEGGKVRLCECHHLHELLFKLVDARDVQARLSAIRPGKGVHLRQGEGRGVRADGESEE